MQLDTKAAMYYCLKYLAIKDALRAGDAVKARTIFEPMKDMHADATSATRQTMHDAHDMLYTALVLGTPESLQDALQGATLLYRFALDVVGACKKNE